MEVIVNERTYFLRRRLTNAWSNIACFEGTTIGFSPSISKKTKRLNTGLDSDTERRLEKELFLEKGALSSALKPDGTPVSPYWSTYSLEVPEKGLELNPSNPAEELAIRLLKVSSLVCGKAQKSPKAIFELYNEEEQAKNSNRIRKERSNAYAYYASMSNGEKVDFCISKGMNVENTKPEIIDDLVGRELEKSFIAFNQWVESDLYKKRVQLQRYVHAGIIRRKQNRYVYRDIQIGIDDASAIAFLEKVNNQRLKEAVIQEYEMVTTQKSIDNDLMEGGDDGKEETLYENDEIVIAKTPDGEDKKKPEVKQTSKPETKSEIKQEPKSNKSESLKTVR